MFQEGLSSSSSSNKNIKYSIKILKEETDLTGNQVLSDSDTDEDFEKEFQKNIDENFSQNPDNENDNESFIKTSICSSHYSSIEGLSSFEGEDLDDDVNDVNLSNDGNDSNISINKFISSLPIDDEIFCTHLPATNRDPTATVPLQTIDKDFKDKLVYISEIFDPAHFWFQFTNGDETYDNFDKFHAQLNDDYNKLNKRECVIAEGHFYEGLIVAAYVNQFQSWYRARIIKNYEGEKKYVRLFFIDYGTNGTCEKSNIRYLFDYFMKYPKYCFRGRLFGIVPLENERSFSVDHIAEFLKKISNYTTYASAIKYEPEEDVYQLKIVRCKGSIDMAEYVLNNKIGQQIASWDNDGEFSIGPPCYLIPTFKNLEHNYPTFFQIEILKKSEIDINWLVDSNHFHLYRRQDIKENMEALIDHPKFSNMRAYFYGSC